MAKVKTFCAVGSAAMTVTASRSGPTSPTAYAPMRYAAIGCTISLIETSVATWIGGSPAPGRGPSRSEMPYASSMHATDQCQRRVDGDRQADPAESQHQSDQRPHRQRIAERTGDADEKQTAPGHSWTRYVGDPVEHGQADRLQDDQ